MLPCEIVQGVERLPYAAESALSGAARAFGSGRALAAQITKEHSSSRNAYISRISPSFGDLTFPLANIRKTA
jgi:hypothetical protein